MYDTYLRWEYHKVQQYNCWHEDRTAAGSGIEARVPFLDHRLVELVTAIPPLRRERLLWDKRLLREAVRDVLPAEVVRRKKVPFFYGEGLRYAMRPVIRMLTQDGGALLDEALTSPGGREFLDPAGMRAALETITGRAAGDLVLPLLRLVNLGLLDQMLRDLPPPLIDQPAAPAPREMPVREWEQDRTEIERRVLDRLELSPDAVPRLAPGVELLHPHLEPDIVYVAIGGEIEYLVDGDNEAWRAFLTNIDGGQQTLGEIAGKTGYRLDSVWSDLCEALECGVVELDQISARLDLDEEVAATTLSGPAADAERSREALT